MRKEIILLPLLLAFVLTNAQKKGAPKFEKVTVENLQKKVYALDSNANAIVLLDIGKSELVGNQRGWFSLEFTQHKRIHVLNKSGYGEGNFEVYLYVDGSIEEELNSVKGTTYNLEDGKVVETKLDKSAVFTDKIDKHHIIKKFTLPNIKEGSIIDFEYKTTSPYLFNLQPWTFQGSVPTLWSEYQLTIPEFLGYIFLGQGYHPYEVNEKKERTQAYYMADARGSGSTERGTVTTKVTDYRLAMKDIPELKEESYTSTLRNHVSKLEFQLSEYRYPLQYKQVMRSWAQFAQEMLEDESFGKSLATNNGWMSDDLNPVLGTASGSLEKAKKIYAFVRDNFVCTNHSNYYLQQPLKNVMKTKKGNVAELNLLLIAMLKHENIDASPIMLSTREHGYTYELYPVLTKFNYVVCQVTIDGKTYYLDASRPRLGFGKLTYECYNGWARIINETANVLDFSPDSIQERKLSSLILMDVGGKWAGNFSQQLGYYESYQLRNKIKEEGKESIIKNIQKSFGEIETESSKIDSVDNLEAPINLQCKFNMSPGDEDILYVNPLFGHAKKENPFKSEERYYPVEMPYGIDETFTASIYVPKGYAVEELPKAIMVKLNEQNEGMFEYAIGLSGDVISLRTRVKLNRAYYLPEEYELLREFYNLIVKKQSEQIVFKKKK